MHKDTIFNLDVQQAAINATTAVITITPLPGSLQQAIKGIVEAHLTPIDEYFT